MKVQLSGKGICLVWSTCSCMSQSKQNTGIIIITQKNVIYDKIEVVCCVCYLFIKNNDNVTWPTTFISSLFQNIDEHSHSWGRKIITATGGDTFFFSTHIYGWLKRCHHTTWHLVSKNILLLVVASSIWIPL